MSLAEQIADRRAAGLTARYEAYGQLVTFRGDRISATLSAPECSVIAGDNGDEIRIAQTCAMPIAAIESRPRRWELITLADGREFAIATLRTDEQRGDYVCQLANSSLAPIFS
jgi:hypothetical protein